jgi:hypothetical protein
VAGADAAGAADGAGRDGRAAAEDARGGGDERPPDGGAADAAPDARVWPAGPLPAPLASAFVRRPVASTGPPADGPSPDAPGAAGDGGPAPMARTQAATHEEGVFALWAAGRGIVLSGTEDEFLFAYRPLQGDAAVTARVREVEGCGAGRVTFGVMLRASLEPHAAYVMSAVTGERGTAAQARLYAGVSAPALRVDGAPALPLWLRVERRGGLVRASVSSDGQTWRSQDAALPGAGPTMFAGLAGTSHDPARPCGALFDSVRIEGEPPPPPDAAAPDGGAGDAPAER